jgi:putative sigma-54 modulation protein
MRIEVVGRDVQVTDPIRTYAESKASKLTKYFDAIQQITFSITRPDHSHRGPFDVELIVDVEKHEDFISHAQADDLYAAIDLVVQKGARQISDFKEQLKPGHHR